MTHTVGYLKLTTCKPNNTKHIPVVRLSLELRY